MEEEEAGLLSKGPAVEVRSDPITDHYAVEARPFARGKFASVRLCRHLRTGVQYAAKYMRKRRRAQDVRHEIMHEAHVLQLSGAHPRIVRMHEVYETAHEMVLVLELVPGGELQRVLDDEEVVAEREASRLLLQILDGVAFLHRHKIAHLDLKPQNLLLTRPFPGGEVKLCDFGISRLITRGTEIREIVGTPDYVAPEVLHYEPISLPTDMWSLGVLTYVLLSGHSPFGGDTKQETFCNITRGALDFPPDLFAGITEDARDFIRRLLVRNPRDRMTAEECLSHPWLGGRPPSRAELAAPLPTPPGATPSPPVGGEGDPRGAGDDSSTKTTHGGDDRSFDDKGAPENQTGSCRNGFHESPLLQLNGARDNKLCRIALPKPNDSVNGNPFCSNENRADSSRDPDPENLQPNLQSNGIPSQSKGASDRKFLSFFKRCDPVVQSAVPQKEQPCDVRESSGASSKNPPCRRSDVSDPISQFAQPQDEPKCQKSLFCQSSSLLQMQRHDPKLAPFGKKSPSPKQISNSVSQNTDSRDHTESSKVRGVVVTQYERIVFSEEIVVDVY